MTTPYGNLLEKAFHLLNNAHLASTKHWQTQTEALLDDIRALFNDPGSIPEVERWPGRGNGQRRGTWRWYPKDGPAVALIDSREAPRIETHDLEELVHWMRRVDALARNPDVVWVIRHGLPLAQAELDTRQVSGTRCQNGCCRFADAGYTLCGPCRRASVDTTGSAP